MPKEIIATEKAPQAIGPYAQAVRAGKTVYISGQIPLQAESMELVQGGMQAQIAQVLDNLRAVAEGAGGSLEDFVKLTVYLTDLTHFPLLNEMLSHYFPEPYPARAVVGIAALPKGAQVEMDAIMELA